MSAIVAMARTRGGSNSGDISSRQTSSKIRQRSQNRSGKQGGVSLTRHSAVNRKRVSEKARTKRGKTRQWSESNMMAAINHMKSTPNASVRKTAISFSVPRTTLRDRLSGRISVDAKPGRKPHLDSSLENKLIDYATNRAKMGIGFGKSQFLKYAGKLAKKHKRGFKRETPSNRWWRLVKSRHAGKLTLRQPEGTASVREQCMDPVKVAKYFTALKQVMEESDLLDKPNNLWNMDETGLQLDVKPKKVATEKGTKHLHSITSGNRETITVIACVNAHGKALPPHVIIKGKTVKSLMGFNTEAAPAGTNWSWSETGWTKQGLAKLWFTNTFLANIGPERPQLLILDGHDSHNFLELIDLAIANRIHIVEMPSHTSNWLQPCDRSLFKPLKDYYRSSAQELMSQFPGIITCRSNFTTLFATAWQQAMTVSNITAGFRSCGIFPFDPSAIPDRAYEPNYLYTVEQIMENPELGEQESGSSLPGSGEMMGGVTGVIEQSVVNQPAVDTDNEHFINLPMVVLTPKEALELLEKQMTPEQLIAYNYLHANGFEVPADDNFVNWLSMKLMVANDECVQLSLISPQIDETLDHTVTSLQIDSTSERTMISPHTDETLEHQVTSPRIDKASDHLVNPPQIAEAANHPATSPHIESTSNHTLNLFHIDETLDHLVSSPRIDETSDHLVNSPQIETTSDHTVASLHIDKISDHLVTSPHIDETSDNPLNSPHIDKTSNHTVTSPQIDSTSDHTETSPLINETSGHLVTSDAISELIATLVAPNTLDDDILQPSDTSSNSAIQRRPPHFPFKNASFPGDGDDDVLPYPERAAKKKTAKPRLQLKYFVLTSPEAHAAKVKFQEDKIKKEKEKQERKHQREKNAAKRRQEKQEKAVNSLKRKSEKSNRKPRAQQAKRRCRNNLAAGSLEGECQSCGKKYGADDDEKREEDWLQCIGCKCWYHESCAECCGILDDINFTCKNCS